MERFWLTLLLCLACLHLSNTFILPLKTTNGSLDVEHLVGHITYLEQTITGFEQTIKIQDVNIVALQTEIANLKADHQMMAGYGTDIATLKSEILNLKASQQVTTSQGNDITTLKTEIVNLKANQQKLDTRISDLQKTAQRDQISAEVTSLKSEVNSVKTEVNLVSNEVISMTSKISNVTRVCQSVSSQVKNEVNAAKTEVRLVSDKVISLTSKFNNLTQDHQSLSSQVKNGVNARKIEMAQVSHKVISLTSKFNNLTQDHQSLSSRVKNGVNARKIEMAQVSNKVISLTSKFSNFTHDYKTLSVLVMNNQNMTKNVEATQGTLLGHVKSAENDRLLLHNSVIRLNKTVSELNNNSTVLSSAIAQLKTEVGFDIWLGNSAVNLQAYSWTTLKFSDIKYNKGGGYNTSTGVFTAPVSGRYLFWTQVEKVSGSALDLVVKKGNSRIGGFSTTTTGVVTGSVITTVPVTAGEKVAVAVYDAYSVACCYNSWFGGTLLHRN